MSPITSRLPTSTRGIGPRACATGRHRRQRFLSTALDSRSSRRPPAHLPEASMTSTSGTPCVTGEGGGLTMRARPVANGAKARTRCVRCSCGPSRPCRPTRPLRLRRRGGGEYARGHPSHKDRRAPPLPTTALQTSAPRCAKCRLSPPLAQSRPRGREGQRRGFGRVNE